MSAHSKGLHVGIIMDGNGRWATEQGLPRLSGHHEGAEALKRLMRGCMELNVTTLTVFAFAIANWKRDQEEVDGLWKLFHTMFENDLQELIDEGVRITVIGRRDDLPGDIRSLITQAEARSKENTAALLQIALNYDGVDEVARMVQRAIETGVKPDEVTSEYVLKHLDTENCPAPDIVVRTGMPAPAKELAVWRGSAFLPLQSVQSVCVATTTLWPAFTPEHLKEIIAFADPDSRLFGGQRKES